MALIKCPKCGKDISDKAKKCPGCGLEVGLNISDAEKETLDLKEAFFDVTDSKKDMSHKQKKIMVEKIVENINNLCILFSTVIMIFFIAMVWRKLDNLSAKIELLATKNQTESETLIDNTENISEEMSDDMLGQDMTINNAKDREETVSNADSHEEQKSSEVSEITNDLSETESTSNDSNAKIGNLDVDSSERTNFDATYNLTDATIIEVNEDNTVKVSVKGVITKSTSDKTGVRFKFLDENGFEICQKFLYISGSVGKFTESFSDIPNTVACVAID